MRRERGGFTLVEVLVVVAILGVLSTIAVAAIWGRVDSAKEHTTRTTIRIVKTQLQTYFIDTGTFPEDLAGLVEDDGRKGRKGPYLEKMPVDGWGQPLQYRVLSSSSGKCELRSAGSDAQMNTSDDITD